MWLRKRLTEGAPKGLFRAFLGFQGAVAQMVERLVRNEEVRGSIPLGSTRTFLLSVATAAGLAAMGSAAAAAPVVVANTNALNLALLTAKGGETFLLAAGTFEPIRINSVHFTSAVTIAPANAARSPILRGITITNSEGLNFRGLKIQPDQPKTDAISIRGGAKIAFSKMDVRGILQTDAASAGNVALVRDSSNISFTDSEFQQANDGIAHLNVTKLTISRNVFHDIREDGVRGGGSSFVTVTGNTFRDFHPQGVVGGSGDHADAIQFWTSNTTASAHDITVTDNLFVRGSGLFIQGVFLRDEATTLPYQRVTISRNLIAGGMFNGVFLDHGDDVTVTDNVIAGFPDRESFIRLTRITKGVVTGNAANELHFTAQDIEGVQSGNVIIPRAEDGGAALLKAWRASHPAAPGLP